MQGDQARRLVINATNRMYLRGMNTTLSGNVSLRMELDRMLITPSGLDKSRLRPSDISLMDISSEKLVNGPKQSSEYHVHARTYRNNAEIKAIVHPHAPYSIGMVSALGAKTAIKEISESDEEYGYYLGKVMSVGIMASGSVELGNAVAKAVNKGARVVIMENHGTVGVGETLHKALDRVEYLEYMMKRLYLTRAAR